MWLSVAISLLSIILLSKYIISKFFGLLVCFCNYKLQAHHGRPKYLLLLLGEDYTFLLMMADLALQLSLVNEM